MADDGRVLAAIEEAKARLERKRGEIIGKQLAEQAERERLAAIEAGRAISRLIAEFNQHEHEQLHRLLALHQMCLDSNTEIPSLGWVHGTFLRVDPADRNRERVVNAYWQGIRRACDRRIRDVRPLAGMVVEVE